MADYLTGHSGTLTVATVALDLMEWTYRETEETAKGRAAGHYGTGRTRLRTDWQMTCKAKILASGTTPTIFKRGASTAFVAATDAGPAVSVTGAGIATETELPVPEGDYIIYTLRIECASVNEGDLPAIAYHA
jgi:hypothetical protein